jgi:biopolymer transport protein ExbD
MRTKRRSLAARPAFEGMPLAEINITPLIDVLMVLLIIFMVLTPLYSRSLAVSPPSSTSSPPSTTTPAPLILSLEETGMDLGGIPVASLDDLERLLKERKIERPEAAIFVRAEGLMTYGRIVDALDVARGAGFERIGMLPDSQEGDLGHSLKRRNP